MKFLSILLFFLSCSLSFAADIPAAVLGSEEEGKAECLATNTDNCIETVCSNSEDPDCNDNCKQTAADKCETLAE